MSYEADRENRFARAEAALQEYLSRIESGEELVLERFVELHSDIAEELRLLHDECAQLACGSSSENLDVASTRPGFLSELARRPNRFADYELRDSIGRGGMGEVVAAFDRVLRRDLALKVVQPGATAAADRARLARFLEEAQITGQLNHPGIIPVHEIGVDPRGRAYFTMKRVEGLDLGKIFDLSRDGDPQWSQARVLGVLLRVCETMAYAHERGVIHRDLKPANIMVGRFGEVYVMDWGLARVLGGSGAGAVRTDRSDPDADSHAESTATAEGSVFGTPTYMSPEQAEGRIDELGPRSDVYAIGVMLYELVAGAGPYEKDGKKLPPRATIAAILAGPPQALETLAPRAPQELVALIEKAVERNIDARYASMLELANDLRAFLDGHVVRAFETGAWAETKKWVSRNKALAAALLTVIATLGGGLLAARGQYLRAETNAGQALANLHESEIQGRAAVAATKLAEERLELALERERNLQLTAKFQGELLRRIDVADLGRSMGTALRDEIRTSLSRRERSDSEIDTSLNTFDDLILGANLSTAARQVVDSSIMLPASRAAASQFAELPEIERTLRRDLSRAYSNLGLNDRALEQDMQCLAICTQLYGSTSRISVTLLHDVATDLRQLGQYEIAESLLRSCMESFERSDGAAARSTLNVMANLGDVLRLRGQPAEAVYLFRQVLERARCQAGLDDLEVAGFEKDFALALTDRGDLTEAVKCLEQVAAIRSSRLGSEDPSALAAAQSLGVALLLAKDHARAESVLSGCLERSRRAHGDDHPDTLIAANSLAAAFIAEHRYSDAEPLIRDTYARTCRTNGPEHPDSLNALNSLLVVLQQQGRPRECVALYEDLLRANERLYGARNIKTAAIQSNLGELLRQMGEYGRAEELQRSALEVFESICGATHQNTLLAMNKLAVVVKSLGKFEEAETLLLSCLEGRRAAFGAHDPSTLTALNNLGRLREDTGRIDEAEACFRECLELRRQALGQEHIDVALSLNNLGNLLHRRNLAEDAEPMLREAVRIRSAASSPDHPETLRYANNHAMILRSLRRLDEAAFILRDTLGRYKSVLGEDHRSTLDAMDNLAQVLKDAGQLEEAEPLARQSSSLYRERWGLGDRDALISLNNLGEVLAARGSLLEAESVLREVLEHRRRVLGNTHRMTLGTYAGLLSVVRARKDLRAEYELIGESVRILDQDSWPANWKRSGSLQRLVTLCRALLEQGPDPVVQSSLDRWTTELAASKD